MADYLSAEDIAAILRKEGDADVSARTVHYYAELKLLPPPEYEGTRPRYSGAHLDAMRELRRQKRAGKRLRELSVAYLGDAPSARSAAMAPAAGPPLSTSRRHGPVTLRVARGLTLQAEGWSDAALARVVEAIRAVLDQSPEGGAS